VEGEGALEERESGGEDEEPEHEVTVDRLC
jgi:hypothetical protein